MSDAKGSDFVHLHTHTAYSLLDGAARIDRLISKAVSLEQKSLAITDHGVMFGVVEFYKEAVKAGIKPILGCEVYVAARSRFDKLYEHDFKSSHLILLAQNETGYINLMKLVSAGYTQGFYNKPRVDKQLLRENSEGIIALSACLSGEIPRAITASNNKLARRIAEEYVKIFDKERFYLEIQDHGIREQQEVNRQVIDLAQKMGIGLVATNDIHYVEQQDAEYQDILMCIQTGKTINDTDRLRYQTNQMYVKSAFEMQRLFSHVPEAVSNTLCIAERCNVELKFGKLHLPKFKLSAGQDSYEYLSALCGVGLRKRYGKQPKTVYIERLDYELNVIKSMGFVDYFLVVWDFIRFAKQRDIPVGPGRGSAVGSIVAYCLGITDVDPIKYNLFFERFLNPERVTMPDVDIDFCHERRAEIIKYVVDKYGQSHVAQIVAFGTMAARAVVRDVGRVLNIPYHKVDIIAKMIPFSLGQTLDNALATNEALRREYNTNEETRRVIDVSKQLEGLPRHASTHATGVVITEEPVDCCVPLTLTDSSVVTQFPMTTLEELGLLKIDFLGLRNLTVIRDVVRSVNTPENTFTLNDIDYNAKPVYEMISRGDTDGVFQLESAGMKSFLRELKPSRLEDIMAGIALHRPGPMEFIPRYIRNKRDNSNVKYHHPMLKPILEETYGCIVYQEQVMQIFQQLAGYSLGRADMLRRAMSKKLPDVINRELNNFLSGAVKRGIPSDVARTIFDEMLDFALYAFNKSHSVAYAVIVYQTAYLKVYYPVHYFAALLSSEMDNLSRVARYIAEAKRNGIDVLPVDVNESDVRFVGRDGVIRFAFVAVKNIGRGLALEIVNERKTNGKYRSLNDFCARLFDKGLNKRALDSLIKCGAFDTFGGTRAQYSTAAPGILDAATDNGKYNFSSQLTLLGDTETDTDLPPVQEYDKRQLLAMEKELTGIYISGNPLETYINPDIQKHHVNIADIIEPDDVMDKRALCVMGIVVKRTLKVTKREELMAFITLEDLSGSIEVVVFPKLWLKYGDMLHVDAAVSITAHVDAKEEETPKLILDSAAGLKPGANQKLYIKVKTYTGSVGLRIIKPILCAFDGGTPVYLHFTKEGKTYAAPKECYVYPCDELYNQIYAALGDDCEIMLRKN